MKYKQWIKLYKILHMFDKSKSLKSSIDSEQSPHNILTKSTDESLTNIVQNTMELKINLNNNSNSKPVIRYEIENQTSYNKYNNNNLKNANPQSPSIK